MTAGLVLAFLGYLLLNAAVKGVHPWAPVVEAFGGTAPPPPGSSGGPGPGSGGSSAGATEHGGGPGGGTTGGLTTWASTLKAAIEQTYPSLQYEGGFNCRRIIPHDRAPSSDDPWSYHAWGQAVDFTGSAAMMAKLVVWGNLPHNRIRFHINEVIRPGSYVNAVHLDVLPIHASTDTPPCAGGK